MINNNVWEQRKLIDIVHNISDGDWIEKEHIYESGVYRIIQTGNIGVGEYLDKKENAKFFYQKDFDDLHANEVFVGDILVCRLADPVGRSIIVPQIETKMVTSVDVAIIRQSEDFDSKFIMQSLNTVKILQQMSNISSGSTRVRISRKNLEKVELSIPSKNEQHTISKLLNIIDQLIASNQRNQNKPWRIRSP